MNAFARLRPSADGVMSPGRRALTAGLSLTVTLAAFEALAVATIMPIAARQLNGVPLYGWTFSAFFLGNLIGIVLAGEQVDRFGLRRPYALGIVLFAAGLSVGGLAPSMPILVAGRAVQGIGAGAIPAVAYVSIRQQYPEELRPRMFAILSSAWVVPGLIGPALAGLVGDHLGWRAVFLGLLPLTALAALISLPALRGILTATDPPALETQSAASRGTQAAAPTSGRLLRAVRVTIGAGLVLAALTRPEPLLAAAFGVAGLTLGLPALRDLVPPGTLVARPGLPVTVLLRGVLTFGYAGTETFIPLTLVTLRGTSATAAGLALTAATLTWSGGAWVQAHRIGIWGARRLIRGGFVLLVIGILAVATVVWPLVPLPVAVAAWAIAGLGMGLAYAPITLTVLELAPPQEAGTATAGLQLSDVLGTALGAGVGGAIVAFGSAAAWDPHVALLVTFCLAAAVTIVGLLLAGRLRAA